MNSRLALTVFCAALLGGCASTGSSGGSGGTGGTGSRERPSETIVDALTASLSAPLTGSPGDPVRGRAIVADRQLGLCLMCHHAPIPEVSSQGELGPDLAGVGRRLSPAELRARLVDPARFNPATLMPSYLRRDGLWRVAEGVRGRALLEPAQVEDVVAYLASLQ